MKIGIFKQKPIVKTLCIFIFLMILLPLYASADTGPKPSITIHVKNYKSTSYKLDLLVKEGYRGLKYDDFNKNKKYPESYKEMPLYRYRENGWIAEHIRNFLLFGSLEGELNQHTNLMEHKFSYHGVPETFKVIIQYDNGEIYVSKEITPIQFKAEIVLDLATGEIYKIPMSVRDLWYAFKLLAITIIIELIVSLLFKIKSKKIVILANVITQPILQLLIYLSFKFISYKAAYVVFYILEVIIVFVEYFIYKKYINSNNKECSFTQTPVPSKGKLFTFSLTANLLTFIVGLLMY